MCLEFINEYTDDIIDQLVNNYLNPDQICAAIGACPWDLFIGTDYNFGNKYTYLGEFFSLLLCTYLYLLHLTFQDLPRISNQALDPSQA